jgi:hypothetical protein
MTIHAPVTLRAVRRRLDCERLGVRSVIARMRDGTMLQLHFATTGPAWSLSDGTHIDNEIAKRVITNARVISCGDALFGDATAQTFRYAED